MIDLSHRQRQVLILLSEGCGTREVAYRLGISPGTVRRHVDRSRTRLGASTTVQAVAIFVRAEVSANCHIAEPEDAAPQW